jgi:endonuclease/exonuclease/phosphatase family metal-dependent hydrolase
MTTITRHCQTFTIDTDYSIAMVNCILLPIGPRMHFHPWLVKTLCDTIDAGGDACDSFYCSTHFPAGNTTRQLWSVEVLSQMFDGYRNEFTSKYNNDPLTMMIAGDFNSAPGSETYNSMIQYGFVDTRILSRERISLDEYPPTTNDWYGGLDSMIDHVWVYSGIRKYEIDNGCNVLSVKHVHVPCCVGQTDLLNRTASDHLMIIVEYSSC